MLKEIDVTHTENNDKEIANIITKIRAGIDPDTRQLHITDRQATAQIQKLLNDRIIEATEEYIRPFLEYCQEQNGLPVCKNCGLVSVKETNRIMSELKAQTVGEKKK